MMYGSENVNQSIGYLYSPDFMSSSFNRYSQAIHKFDAEKRNSEMKTENVDSPTPTGFVIDSRSFLYLTPVVDRLL